MPLQLETRRVPLAVSYFSPTGFFGNLTGTFIDQAESFTRIDSLTEMDRKADHFRTVDLSLGFRLPKRRGLISFDVKNLFDENFSCQTGGFDRIGELDGDPVATNLVPERILFGRLTLAL